MKPGWTGYLFAWISGFAVTPLAASLEFDECDLSLGYSLLSVAAFVYAARLAATLMVRFDPRQSWNERMWSDGGRTQPSPTIGQAIKGGFLWFEVQCSRVLDH